MPLQRSNIRVGIFVLTALVILALTVLAIGKRQQLFQKHNMYYSTFTNVRGLQEGAPVNLNGVKVGFVERVQLPTDPSEVETRVDFRVDAAYQRRIREDTRATIQTIGLLGDKYLELTGGSLDAPPASPGGLVPGHDPAQLQEFIAGGEDVMENLLAISSSLRVILQRVEAGEGIFGQLTKDPEDGDRLSDSVRDTVETVQTIAHRIERGEGLLGRLLRDDAAGKAIIRDLTAAASSARSVATTVEDDLTTSDGVWNAVFRDPEARELLHDSIAALNTGSAALAAVAEDLADGSGTIPRLMSDEGYADAFLDDLADLVENLRKITAALDDGTGTAGAFLHDPQLYRDLENVVRGVERSKILSWFIRNRRRAGEEAQRSEDQQRLRGSSPTSEE
jgi:phospholipid/cholesterol/gamma-HCH transport system substrate-binding protein